MIANRVYVGGLSHEVRERDVEDFFRGYGRIKEVALKNGYCFVEFTNEQDADDATKDLNDQKLLGRRVVVQKARKPLDREQYSNRGRFIRNHTRFSPARRTSYRVTVKNLSTRVQWQDLKDFLMREGKVTYAKAHNLRPHQGMVEFDSYNDMKRVIRKFNGVELNGRKLIIEEAQRLSRSRSRSPLGNTRSMTQSRSPVGRAKSPSRSRPRITGETRNLRKRSPENSEEGSGVVFKRNGKSCSRSKSPSTYQEAMKKRSREHSEEGSEVAFKRHKRSCSRSESPSTSIEDTEKLSSENSAEGSGAVYNRHERSCSRSKSPSTDRESTKSY